MIRKKLKFQIVKAGIIFFAAVSLLSVYVLKLLMELAGIVINYYGIILDGWSIFGFLSIPTILFFLFVFLILKYDEERSKVEPENKKQLERIQEKKKTTNTIVWIIILTTGGLSLFGWLSGRVSIHFRFPERPIEEVIIRTYGNVADYLIEAAEEAIIQEIGIDVSFDNPRPGFKEDSPYYNHTRGQFDADKMWQFDLEREVWEFEKDFAEDSSVKRLIRIVDVDLYTEIQPERPYVFSRSAPNTNIILISTYHLEKISDVDDDPAPRELAALRMRKLVLDTLSWSVGLHSPKERCVTNLKKFNLMDLDKGESVFSDKSRKKLEHYFKTNYLMQDR